MTTSTAPPDVDLDAASRTAEREAVEAAQLVAELKRRVQNGDETITAAQIGEARQLAEFAEDRAKAAATKAERARKAARRAQLLQLAAELRAHEHDGDRFVALFVAFEEALEALCQAADERAATVAAYRDRMNALHVTKPDLSARQGHGLPEDAGLFWSYPAGGVTSVGVDGRMVSEVRLGPIIGAAVKRAAERHRMPELVRALPELHGPDGKHDLHTYLRGKV